MVKMEKKKIRNFNELKCHLFGHEWKIIPQQDTKGGHIDYRIKHFQCLRCGEIQKIRQS